MALTNYWWLLIWIVTVGLAIKYIVPKEVVIVNGKKELRWNWLASLAVAFPYILWAAFRKNFGDTEVYRRGYLSFNYSLDQLANAFNDATKDKGFSVLTAFLKNVLHGSDVWYFAVIAIIQMICLIYVYRKYSCDYWLSIFLFVASTDYLSWMHNGMRQFLAVCIVFACTPLIMKKNYVPTIIIILLASTIHGTALIMIPFFIVAQGKAWNKRTLFLLLLVLLSVVFVDKFTNILQNMLVNTQYEDTLANAVWTGDDGTNPIRVLFYSIPAIMSFVGMRYIKYSNDMFAHFCVNMSLITASIYIVSMVTSGIFMGRLPIYASLYSYCLIPWLLKEMFEPRSKTLMLSCLIFGFVLFFYLQVFIAWGV